MSIKRTQIVFNNLDPSPALEASIAKKAGALDRGAHEIQGCRVVVSVPHGHRASHARRFRVTVDFTVPGRELAVEAESRDAFVAVRDAFLAARRRLTDFVSERRDAQRAA